MDVMKLNLNFCPRKECEWVDSSSEIMGIKTGSRMLLSSVTLEESILIQGLDWNPQTKAQVYNHLQV